MGSSISFYLPNDISLYFLKIPIDTFRFDFMSNVSLLWFSTLDVTVTPNLSPMRINRNPYLASCCSSFCALSFALDSPIWRLFRRTALKTRYIPLRGHPAPPRAEALQNRRYWRNIVGCAGGWFLLRASVWTLNVYCLRLKV